MANNEYKQLYKPFQHWVDAGNIYLIGDLHIGDEDMNWRDITAPEEIFRRINKALHKYDTLICLGDLGEKFYQYQRKGQGIRDDVYRVLIRGNHDNAENDKFFGEVYKGGLQISPKLYLSHEPVRIKGCVNIHGHDHGAYYDQFGHCQYHRTSNEVDDPALWTSLETTPNGGRYFANLNICGEGLQFIPVNLKELIKKGLLKVVDDIHRITISEAEAHPTRF